MSKSDRQIKQKWVKMSTINELRKQLEDLQLYEDGMTKTQMEEMLHVVNASLIDSITNKFNNYEPDQNGTKSQPDNRYLDTVDSKNVNFHHKETNYETINYKIRLLKKLANTNKEFENQLKEYEKLLSLLNDKSMDDIDNDLIDSHQKVSPDATIDLDKQIESLRQRFRRQRRLLIVQDFYKCKENGALNDSNEGNR